MTMINRLVITFCAYALVAGCFQASNNQLTYEGTISGTVSLASHVVIDSDVNDISAPYADNNDPARAQSIHASSTVLGFATAVATQGDEEYERFAQSTDTDDYFLVKLNAGDSVELEVLDFSEHNDLDLFVFSIDSPSKVAGSYKSGLAGQFEGVDITQSGRYIVNVYASAGTSSYSLKFKPTNPAALLSVPSQFRTGQGIAQPRALAQPMQQGKTSDARPLPKTITFPQSRQTFSASSSSIDTLEAFNSYWKQQRDTLLNIKQLAQDPTYEYAEPNLIRFIHARANDQYFYLQDSLEQTQVPQAWDMTQGSSQVVVAIIDTGVLTGHEDLVGKLESGYDFIKGVSGGHDLGDHSDPEQISWHGTHVASIVGANTNNNKGMAGISWHSKLMPLRVIDEEGGDADHIACAIRYAAGLRNCTGLFPARKADIINMSFGAEGPSITEQNAINDAIAAGAILLAASGNDGHFVKFYPAAYPGVIAVAATDQQGRQASYSNSGQHIRLAAPGGEPDDFSSENMILGAFGPDNNSYAYSTGTSMATPHVAGVVALMKSANPQLTSAMLETAISSCTITNRRSNCSYDTRLGYGEINAFYAVQYALNPVDISPKTPLLSSSERVVFSRADSQALELSNLSNELITALSYTAAPWLTLNGLPKTIAPSSTHTIELVVNTRHLTLGYYQTSLNISYRLGASEKVLSINVELDLSATDRDAQPSIYLLLEDVLCIQQQMASNHSCYRETASNPISGAFSFTDIANGEYRIHASTDLNANHLLCEQGEACVVYPKANQSFSINQLNQQQDLSLILDRP